MTAAGAELAGFLAAGTLAVFAFTVAWDFARGLIR